MSAQVDGAPVTKLRFRPEDRPPAQGIVTMYMHDIYVYGCAVNIVRLS